MSQLGDKTDFTLSPFMGQAERNGGAMAILSLRIRLLQVH